MECAILGSRLGVTEIAGAKCVIQSASPLPSKVSRAKTVMPRRLPNPEIKPIKSVAPPLYFCVSSLWARSESYLSVMLDIG